MRIALTGTLANGRSFYVDKITRTGHTFVKSVSKTTDILVLADEGEKQTNKYKKAVACETRIMLADEFYTFLKTEESKKEQEQLSLADTL